MYMMTLETKTTSGMGVFGPFFSWREMTWQRCSFFTDMDATTKQQRTCELVRAWKQAKRDKVLAQKKRYRERHRAEIQESKKLSAAGHRPQINEYRC